MNKRALFLILSSTLLFSCQQKRATSSSTSDISSQNETTSSSAVSSSSQSSSIEPSTSQSSVFQSSSSQSSATSSSSEEKVFPAIPENKPIAITPLIEPLAPTLPFTVPDFSNYSEGLTYALLADGTGYSVSNANNTLATPNLVIPETHEGKPVSEIASEGFTERTWISSVAIPKTIKKIGDGAFSLTNIKQLYFDAESCQDFNARNWVFYPSESQSGIQVVFGKDVKRIPARLFYPLCTEPTKLPAINDAYFENGSSLETIGEYAFYHSEKLARLVLPASLKGIEDFAFSGTGLTSLYLPEGFEKIGENVFSSTSSLTEVYFPSTLTSLGSSAFFYSGLVEADLSLCGSLTSLPSSLFKDCASLMHFNSPRSLSLIGSECLKNCSGLTTLYLGGEADSLAIGASAFEGCAELVTLYLPKNLNQLGTASFKGCAKVQTLYYDARDLSDFANANEVFRAFGDPKGFDVLFAKNVQILPSHLFYAWSEESARPKINRLYFLSPELTEIHAAAFLGVIPQLIDSSLTAEQWQRVTVAANNDSIGEYVAKEAAK